MTTLARKEFVQTFGEYCANYNESSNTAPIKTDNDNEDTLTKPTEEHIYYVRDLPCVFISYMEPNAEDNWNDLLKIAPWSQRVKNVKGFSAAHKAACELSADSFEWVITVDGDNTVNHNFFDIAFTDPGYVVNVISFNSKNSVNGLNYGNGGIKIWRKSYLKMLNSHEDAIEGASPAESIEFCWDQTYKQLFISKSTTNIHGSPMQALKAGFREGVKLTLDKGCVIESNKLMSDISRTTLYTMLLIWGSVGADVKNGLYSILGTRLGTYYCNVLQKDLNILIDYTELESYLEQYSKMKGKQLIQTIENIGNEVFDVTGINFLNLDSFQSKFFKSQEDLLSVHHRLASDKVYFLKHV